MIIVLQNRFFVYFCHPEREKRSLQIQAKIAQLVEHDLAKVGVAGSSPVFRSQSIYARVVELVDTQDLKSCVHLDVRVQVPPRVQKGFNLVEAFFSY